MAKTQTSEIVSTRKTFDGVEVYLHADGSVSTRMWFFRGKFSSDVMWRAWGDIGIPAYMREVKRGKLAWQRPFVKRSARKKEGK